MPESAGVQIWPSMSDSRCCCRASGTVWGQDLLPHIPQGWWLRLGKCPPQLCNHFPWCVILDRWILLLENGISCLQH